MQFNNKKVFRPQAQNWQPAPKHPLAHLPPEVINLQNERDALGKRIKTIEQRLQFAYSEPLNDYCQTLMKQDIALTCQMIDILIGLKKRA